MNRLRNWLARWRLFKLRARLSHAIVRHEELLEIQDQFAQDRLEVKNAIVNLKKQLADVQRKMVTPSTTEDHHATHSREVGQEQGEEYSEGDQGGPSARPGHRDCV